MHRLILLTVLAVAIIQGADAAYRKVLSAKASVHGLTEAGAQYADIDGTITFNEPIFNSGPIEIIFSLTGFPPNSQFKIHVHEHGNVLGLDGKSTGGHFIGTAPSRPSGISETGYILDGQLLTSNADGDIGPVTYSESITYKLDGSPDQFVGRSIIILDNTADATRIAAGVIGISHAGRHIDTENDVSDVKEATCLLRPTGDASSSSLNGYVRFSEPTLTSDMEYYVFLANAATIATFSLDVLSSGDLSSGPTSVFRDTTETTDIGNLEASLSSDSTGQFSNRGTSATLSLHGDNSIVGRSLALKNAAGQIVARCVVGISQIAADLATASTPLSGQIKKVLEAQAVLSSTNAVGTPGHGHIGLVEFRDTPTGTQVHWIFSGLQPSSVYNIHIHEFGDTFMPDGSSTGFHYFGSRPIRENAANEVGAIGNGRQIRSDAQGRANAVFDDNLIHLNGADSCIGRSVVVHNAETNVKISQGVIGRTMESLVNTVDVTTSDFATCLLSPTSNNARPSDIRP